MGRKRALAADRPDQPSGKAGLSAEGRPHRNSDHPSQDLPRRGVPTILRSKGDGSTVPYEPKEAARLVHRLRDS